MILQVKCKLTLLTLLEIKHFQLIGIAHAYIFSTYLSLKNVEILKFCKKYFLWYSSPAFSACAASKDSSKFPGSFRMEICNKLPIPTAINLSFDEIDNVST